jgi:hypothetical protein
MAFAAVKIANRTSGAPGAGDFDRSENMELFIAREQEIQLFVVTTTGGTVDGELTTDFEKVLGGFAWKQSDGAFSTVIDVKSNATDPIKADVSAIPADGVYLVAVFGYKIPAQVT